MAATAYIIDVVNKLVEKYGTRDPYELCRELGIKIHYIDMQKKLKGFFFYQSRQKNIVIDCNVNKVLELILVAHEARPVQEQQLYPKCLVHLHKFYRADEQYLRIFCKERLLPSF